MLNTIDPHPYDGLLSVVLKSRGTTTFVDLSGEWDLSGLPAFRGAAGRVFEAEPDCVVLDLSQLTFIDSSGLHATMDFARRSQATGGRLVIIPGPRRVHRAFELCGLTRQLPFIEPPFPHDASDGSIADIGDAGVLVRDTAQ